MSTGSLASSRLTASAWRCRLAVGVTDVLVGWRWQPASGIGRPPDAMRPSKPSVSWLRT
jgi:hypothetical protein